MMIKRKITTLTTDANGRATYRYNSAGIGDINFGVDFKENDGSLVTETFTVQDYLWVPKLDGTETIHQVNGSPVISNNELSSDGNHSGYIGAWDNTGNWELTFQAKWSNGNCGIWIIKPNETNRDSNDLLMLAGRLYKHANGSSEGNYISFTGSYYYGTYYPIKLTKNGNNLTLEYLNQSYSVSWSLISTLSSLCIGVDAWNGTSYVKDIVVKPL